MIGGDDARPCRQVLQPLDAGGDPRAPQQQPRRSPGDPAPPGEARSQDGRRPDRQRQ
ncbi:MAG TPA: hypothetical protein VG477_01740 [Thermoanaerobaculia bacterium]|nr:hypothetical protein [Thermoanaerobaculia bacterium]